MVNICGQDFTLYVDSDRGKFHYLDFPGRVIYMRARVERDLVHPCRVAVRVQDLMAVGLLVPGLICAGISAAGTFLNGGRAAPRQDQRVFTDFVKNFMHADLQRQINPPGAKTFADWLYSDVRCGLSHSFALEYGHIEDARIGCYVNHSPVTGEPQINQDELVEDFARAWILYLDEVLANPTVPVAQAFGRRFAQIFHD